jgi:hypothetical protein
VETGIDEGVDVALGEGEHVELAFFFFWAGVMQKYSVKLSPSTISGDQPFEVM